MALLALCTRKYDSKKAYDVAYTVIRAFKALTKHEIDTPQISYAAANEGIGQCIAEFKSLQVRAERLTYLDGWQLKSKEGKVLNFAIGKFHEAFGDKLTAYIYHYVCEHGTTQKSTTGNAAVLAILLFKGGIASPSLNIPASTELWLAEKERSTEYRPFNSENSEMSASEGTIKSFIMMAKLINTNVFKDNESSPSIEATKALSIRKINDLVALKPAGRTQTLHPDVVFKLTRQSFEFVLKYQQDILDTCLSALSQGVSKSAKSRSNKEQPDHRRSAFIPEIHQNMSSTERGHFMQTKVMSALNELNEKGVKAMGIRQVLPFKILAAD